MSEQQTHFGPSDTCFYGHHEECPFPIQCQCACHAKAGEPTPPATPQSHDPWKLIATARDTFHANGHLNPHLRAAWEMAANYLDRMLGDHPATPQPETLLDVPHAEVDALVEAIYAERRAFSPPPDVERLTREAFRAGFLAVCRKKSDDTPLDMLTRVWTFDGVAAADLESEAYAAWRALSPSTPGEPT